MAKALAGPTPAQVLSDIGKMLNVMSNTNTMRLLTSMMDSVMSGQEVLQWASTLIDVITPLLNNTDMLQGSV
jgi:hypothetical protein